LWVLQYNRIRLDIFTVDYINISKSSVRMNFKYSLKARYFSFRFQQIPMKSTKSQIRQLSNPTQIIKISLRSGNIWRTLKVKLLRCPITPPPCWLDSNRILEFWGKWYCYPWGHFLACLLSYFSSLFLILVPDSIGKLMFF
jgi:hypothetical protein